MKKINSISYGGKIIGCGLIFLIPVPLFSYFLQKHFHFIVLSYIIRISILLGIAIECFFAIHLIIELHQDKTIQQYCQCHRKIKVKLREGRYECLNCGNLAVKKQDDECAICGVKFGKDEIKSVEKILRKQ